jgi:precorrin-2/cobalt-factor-2 C20-methyltransferase
VRKTSVYLPERLKDRLAAAARTSGRSEANLIRVAVETFLDQGPVRPGAVVRREDPTSDAGARSRGAAVIGVGVGPGDAGLLTVRALDVLRSVDRVFAPCTSTESVGRAEAIVRDAAPDVRVERLVFVMQPDGDARHDAISAAAARVVDCARAGERVAFVTLGDPNVYSTFSAVADVVARQAPEVPVVTVPGIMAFQELAARAGTVLVDGRESLVLLPAHTGDAEVAAAVRDGERAVVVYKGGRHLPALAERLGDAGRLDDAVLGELLGMPGERVAPVRAVADRPASYLATVIVPPRRRPSGGERETRPSGGERETRPSGGERTGRPSGRPRREPGQAPS